MRVHTTGNVEEYAAAVEAFLKDDPCARNVLLTVIDLVRTAPATYRVAPSFWWITDSDAVVGAASWTPPYNLLVSSLLPEAAGDLADRRHPSCDRARPPAAWRRPVPRTSARAVAAAWTAATGDAIERDRPILLNELVLARRGTGAAGRSPTRAR